MEQQSSSGRVSLDSLIEAISAVESLGQIGAVNCFGVTGWHLMLKSVLLVLFLCYY